MVNYYYQPYYTPPPHSVCELEHYGIKGMKWGKKKVQTEVDLKGVRFGDIKVYQTGAWLAANPISIPSVSEIRSSAKSAKENKVLKNGIISIAKVLPKYWLVMERKLSNRWLENSRGWNKNDSQIA